VNSCRPGSRCRAAPRQAYLASFEWQLPAAILLGAVRPLLRFLNSFSRWYFLYPVDFARFSVTGVILYIMYTPFIVFAPTLVIRLTRFAPQILPAKFFLFRPPTALFLALFHFCRNKSFVCRAREECRRYTLAQTGFLPYSKCVTIPRLTVATVLSSFLVLLFSLSELLHGL